MTTQSNKNPISEVLWSNSQIKGVEFNQRNFKPTNRGHGLFVETEGKDILIDLRLSSEKPFWGHSHPLLIQHNHNNLNLPLEQNNYSTSKAEFTRMIETFQRVNLTEVLDPNFKLTYTNIVITVDESILNYNKTLVKETLTNLIQSNLDSFFWIVEKDIHLLCEKDLFFFQSLMNKAHVHLCLDFHFINSIFIYSHHLFSEDENIQIFLAIKNLAEKVISINVNGKNTIDFEVIDQFFSKEFEVCQLSRRGRYLISHVNISPEKLLNNGIISSKPSQEGQDTILALPIACTKNELIDTLERVKLSL